MTALLEMRAVRALVLVAFMLLGITALGNDGTPVHAQDAPVPDGVHPHGTRIGVPVVDRVLDAVEADESLVAHLAFVEEPCLSSPGPGDVGCPDGVADGTPIAAVFVGGCSAGSLTEAEEGALRDSFGEIGSDYYLYAVGRSTSDPDSLYSLFLVRGSGEASEARNERLVRLHLNEDGIRVKSRCQSASDGVSLLEEVVLAPFGNSGTLPPSPPNTGNGGLRPERPATRDTVVMLAGLAIVGVGTAAGQLWVRRR